MIAPQRLIRPVEADLELSAPAILDKLETADIPGVLHDAEHRAEELACGFDDADGLAGVACILQGTHAICNGIKSCHFLLNSSAHLLEAHLLGPLAEALPAEHNMVPAHKPLLAAAHLALVCTATVDLLPFSSH